ncbi:hypothetical protein GCM10027168_67600 [Streptomyces capparidis]
MGGVVVEEALVPAVARDAVNHVQATEQDLPQGVQVAHTAGEPAADAHDGDVVGSGRWNVSGRGPAAW